VIDLRATNPWLEELGLPTDDPMAERIAIALNDPRDDADQLAQSRLDEWSQCAAGTRLRAGAYVLQTAA
jgi:hypothetical protein